MLLPKTLETLLVTAQETDVDLCFGAARNEVVGEASLIHDATKLIPAPISSTSLIRRDAFERFGRFGTDNFSWATWYLDAKSAGLTERAISQQVSIRRIHQSNVSHDAEAKAFFFTLIRQRLAAGKAVKSE